MSSRLQLDVCNLSLGMCHLVNAYKVEAGTVYFALCDPYPSALSMRYYNKGALVLHSCTSWNQGLKSTMTITGIQFC